MNIEIERPRCSMMMLQARWGVGMAQKRQAGVGRGARDPIHACDQLKIEHCSLILRWVVTMRRTWDYLERTKKTAQKVGQHLEWN